VTDFAVVMTIRGEDDLSSQVYMAAVDAALAYFPNRSIIIVDDCSPAPVLQDALVRWETRTNVHVIRMGPPVVQGFYQEKGIAAGDFCSFGHAPTLDRGLWFARHGLGLHRAFVLDGDVCVFEPIGAMAQRVIDDLTDEQIIIGEWNGTPVNFTEPQASDARFRVCGTSVTEKAVENIPSAIRSYGYVNFMCSAVNLDMVWHPRAMQLLNVGWVANAWYQSQMQHGAWTGYAPFFRAGAAAHIGAVAVATARGESYGNSHETHYARKGFGNFYTGYLQFAAVRYLRDALAGRRDGEPLPSSLFLEPLMGETPRLDTYLAYDTPFVKLDDDQTLTLKWMHRESQQPLATITITLDGNVACFSDLRGRDPVDERACYEEAFEHTPCLGRSTVWTPTSWRDRLGLERPRQVQRDDHDIFSWLYLVPRGESPWRWSEHYGWDQAGKNPLVPPTR
jgi:hypothetical protein